MNPQLEEAAMAGVIRLLDKKSRALDGDIQKVTVVSDEEQRLLVEVTITKLLGATIWGEVLDKDKKVQRLVKCPPVMLNSPTNLVQLVFDLDGQQLQEPTLDSTFLRISVAAGRRAANPAILRSYILPKRWQKEVLPENVLVRIRPRPEGAAASLGPQPGGLPARPRALDLSAVKVDRVNPLLLTAPMRMQATAAPAVRAAAPPARTATRAAPGPSPVAVSPKAISAASVLKSQQPVMNRTAPAVAALPSASKLRRVESFAYGLQREVTSKNGRGPGSSTIDLLQGTLSDIPLQRESITKISPRVFQDQNPDSGIFYFFPHTFSLDWEPEQSYLGYTLRMLYSAATAEGQAGEVLFACRLNAGVDTRDVQFATELLRAYTNRYPATRFSELRPLPIEKPPELSLSGGLAHQYNIPPEKVAINAISDILGQTDVSWVTDTVTKENLQLALVEDVGINGTLTLAPAGAGLAAQLVPVSIKLADVGTFGEILWTRGQRWRNQTPYPVRLKYLHALLLQDNVPTVYSWNLESATVPPQAQVEFDASTIPAWLDRSAKRMWLDYAPVEDCSACDQKVIAAITGGVTSLGSSQITFHTIKPLADTGAYEISVQVRSKYFDPRSRELQVKPVLVLNADDKDFTTGPIYLVNRQPGEAVPNDPLFEYFLELGMPDGTIHRATRWMASDNLRVLLGKMQLEQALGTLPKVP